MNNHLIRILSNHLNKEITAPFDTDWVALLKLANQHQVAAIVYTQCKNFIPQRFKAEYEQEYSASLSPPVLLVLPDISIYKAGNRTRIKAEGRYRARIHKS